jgi:hypothetical protein
MAGRHFGRSDWCVTHMNEMAFQTQSDHQSVPAFAVSGPQGSRSRTWPLWSGQDLSPQSTSYRHWLSTVVVLTIWTTRTECSHGLALACEAPGACYSTLRTV